MRLRKLFLVMAFSVLAGGLSQLAMANGGAATDWKDGNTGQNGVPCNNRWLQYKCDPATGICYYDEDYTFDCKQFCQVAGTPARQQYKCKSPTVAGGW